VCSLRVATLNVHTLGYDEDAAREKQPAGMMIPKRMIALQDQFHKKGADIVASQESRAPQSSTFQTQKYI